MKAETQPLEEFVITVDGKPFIKCDDPKQRIDFEFKKFKPKRSFKMSDTTLVDQILEALFVDGKMPNYSEQQLVDIIEPLAGELTEEIVTTIINTHGYPDLSEEDVRNIIRGIVDNQVA